MQICETTPLIVQTWTHLPNQQRRHPRCASFKKEMRMLLNNANNLYGTVLLLNF